MLNPRRHASSTARSAGLSWVVLGAFTLLALGLSWPLVANLSSRVPGTDTWAFDESTFLWNIWYFKHALIDLHASPLHSGLIWYPLGVDLILYTYNFFNALIALPLQVAVNLPFASNLTLLLSTVLSGFGAYLLTLYLLGGRDTEAPSGTGVRPRGAMRAAAILAGVIYAFASNRAVYAALGHYDMVTTQWLPFYALYLLKTLRRPTLRHAALAGLFFTLAALAEMIFASFLALFSLIVLLVQWPGLRRRWAALRGLAVAGAVALVLWSPVLVPIVREFVTGDYALTGWGESLKLSADVVGMVTPTDLNPVIGPADGAARPAYAAETAAAGRDALDTWRSELRAVEAAQGRFSDINTVFLGYATLLLAVVGGWTARRHVRAWLWTALVFGVLALGPLLQIGGRYRFDLNNLLPEGVTFPLPFALLHFVPFINANRAPNRNSVILMLALAVLAAYGVQALLSLRNRVSEVERSSVPGRLTWLASGALAAVLVIEHLAVPLPTTDARVPEIYEQIAAEPEDFAVMHLPLGWRNSFGVLGSELTQLQYYQTTHQKPMIGGNISRAPDFKMEYFGRIPLFRALTELEMHRDVPEDVDRAARAQAGALMALYDVRYFLTFPPIPGRYPYADTWERTQAYALDVLPLEQPAFWEQDGIRAYRVIQPALPSPFRVDLGTAGVEAYLGAGWHLDLAEQPLQATAFWATDTEVDLYLPMAEPADRTLSLAVAPLAYPGAPPQSLWIQVNGTTVLPEIAALDEGWQVITAEVPASATRRGPNYVSLHFGWAKSPRQVLPDPAGRAEIGSTGVVSPVNIDVHSFDEAFVSTFTAGGTETKPSPGRRGYNVVVLDPRGGRVVDAQGFDTAANIYEAERLAAYLHSIPAGQIVVAATKGDATAHLTPAAVEALQSLGSGVAAPDQLAGQAHALVGVKGAAPGTAAESMAPVDTFLRVGGDFRTLAAAVDWVELGP